MRLLDICRSAQGCLCAGTGTPLSAQRRGAAVPALAHIRPARQSLAARRPGELLATTALSLSICIQTGPDNIPVPGGAGGGRRYPTGSGGDADRVLTNAELGSRNAEQSFVPAFRVPTSALSTPLETTQTLSHLPRTIRFAIRRVLALLEGRIGRDHGGRSGRAASSSGRSVSRLA